MFVQVFVQTEARLAAASHALQLGQVNLIPGQRPSSVAPGDGIGGGRGPTGRSVGGGGLGR